MNRRQVLLALLSGAASTEVLGRAFDVALDTQPLTVDEWQSKVQNYGQEYITSLDAAELQARIARDLSQLQTHLDHPILGAVAANLLTLYGLTVQSTAMPDGTATRWYHLGIRAADRSGDTEARVWTRGRAALSLAYHGLESDTVTRLAQDALSLSDRPSPGRLCAELALMQVENANRTFEAVGEGTVSDFTFSEWRMAHVVSRIASRQGDEPSALEAQKTIQRTLPTSMQWPTTALELQRALLMVTCGDQAGGLQHARYVVDGLTSHERNRPSVWLLMQEIEGTPA